MYAKQNVNFANQKPYSQKKSVKRFFKKYRSNLPCYNYLYLLMSCKSFCAGIKNLKNDELYEHLWRARRRLFLIYGTGDIKHNVVHLSYSYKKRIG